MILTLNVKNVALIDHVEIEFSGGLNILSGETGAGKSILIDSINFVLGERPGKDFIRSGESRAEVSALVFVEKQVAVELNGLGAETGEDGSLLLERSMTSNGRSICRINGRTVTVGMLREVSALLVDVHGQHEHQSLLNPDRHINLVDRFCGGEMEKWKLGLGAVYKNYRENARQIREVSGGGDDREKLLEIYHFQLNELTALRLSPDEEESLEARRNILQNGVRLLEAAQAVTERIGGDGAAMEDISSAMAHMDKLAETDPSQKELRDSLYSLYEQLTDFYVEMETYRDGLDFDPEELADIEERLHDIYRVKKKYGRDVPGLLELAKELGLKIQNIEKGEERLKELKKEKKRLEAEIVEKSGKMTGLRKSAGEYLQFKIEENLKDLGMKNARFSIGIEKKKEYNANGCDKVEFLISPNMGEELKPLSSIASGGEMSRVMLALKAALSDFDSIETFIFDEIDAGVSGRTAQQVAEKMAFLGKTRQVLCITHLPQIAAMGDANFLIEKSNDGARSFTAVRKLQEEDCVKELARLIGGVEITGATLQAASEMRSMAQKIKIAPD